jgi:D-glycero-alpha-D-manno-heptose-7-phosphate kinase
MIITRTPFRISFFGGGTDYPIFYNEHGGSVLSTTINKYCYITVRYLPPFFDHQYRIRYDVREDTQTPDQIKHPSVRECLKFIGSKRGIEMIHTSDIPAMSGIGSSSSFTVGLLNSLYSLKGQIVSKRQLALDATYVEQELIKENVGSQDQAAAAFGGFNKIKFGGREKLFIQPVTIGDEKLAYLQKNLLFYFTGFSRISSEIAEEQIKQTPAKISELKNMGQMVDEAVNILNGAKENFKDFGRLLHESWKLKKSISSRISTSQIDLIYEKAMAAGAVGGKICGAGGGGFMLLFVPPEQQPSVKEALKDFLQVPCNFENIGTHTVFYSSI